MSDLSALKEYATPGGLMTLLGLIIAFLFTRRGNNEVANRNARANRESRFEENIQRKYEELQAKNSELREEVDELREGRAVAQRELAQARGRIHALLGMLSPEERADAARWMPSQLGELDGLKKKP